MWYQVGFESVSPFPFCYFFNLKTSDFPVIGVGRRIGGRPADTEAPVARTQLAERATLAFTEVDTRDWYTSDGRAKFTSCRRQRTSPETTECVGSSWRLSVLFLRTLGGGTPRTPVTAGDDTVGSRHRPYAVGTSTLVFTTLFDVAPSSADGEQLWKSSTTMGISSVV